MTSKQTLRKKYLEIRGSLSKKRREKASQVITKHLLQVTASCRYVLSFASKEEEINLWPLNKVLAKQGRLLLPKTLLESGMCPFEVTDLENELVLSSKWKVLEPNPALCKEIPVDQIDYVIVPGLAFDDAHGRLGYGQGFYDRFLAKLTCPMLGVGFKEQRLDGAFSHETHDIPLTDVYLT